MADKIPEGYMEDLQGRLVPVAKVPEIDRLRDELVIELTAGAKDLHDHLAAYKTKAMNDIKAFVTLSAEKYGVKRGGTKGNVTLLAYNGAFKVELAIADRLTFDERLQAAKELVDACIDEWSEGSRDEIKILVQDAFSVDKHGRINTKRILSLRRIKFDHPKWKMAMEALSDAIQIVGTQEYIRIYRRTDRGAWDPIPLDLAAV